ncbi:MAG: tetratricopeptide repeat protein, partial [Bacteroidota bacterium]
MASPNGEPTDSLRNLLHQADGLTRLEVLDELCYYFRPRNDDSLLHYATLGWQSSENEYAEMSMLFADYMGAAHYRHARYDSAYWYLSRALTLTQQLPDSAYMVTVANSMATLHFIIGDLEQGARYAIMALQTAEAIGDSPRFIASCLMNVAAMQHKLKNHAEAKSYFLRALSLLQDEKGLRVR